MPRSSRHKSHKQSKHSSRDDREYSDSDADVKTKEKKDEPAVRVSKDSCSREKRKPSLQSRDGNASEERVSSRSRKDRVDLTGSDRWSGGGDERTDDVVVDKEAKGASLRRLDSDKGSKSKGSADSKSKSNRRHEGGIEKQDMVSEKDERKRSKVDSKSKLEKDSDHPKVLQHKKSNGKEPTSDRDRKMDDAKHDTEKLGRDGEGKRRQGSKLADFDGERDSKRVKHAESPLQDEFCRTSGSSERDKNYNDPRERDEKRLSSRDDHAKNGKHKDEKQRDGGDKDKYREGAGRDHRHSDRKQREDIDREKRHRDEKYKDERVSRDHPSDKHDLKQTRKSRLKDDIEKKRSDGKEDRNDSRSQSEKARHYDAEKKSSSSKFELSSDRGRSNSRHADPDSGLVHNRRKSSPSCSSHISKDQHRQSKQTEVKFRPSGSESSREVAAVSGAHEKSREKSLQKDDTHLGELSTERWQNSDGMEKSSPPSADRRLPNRANVRWGIDNEDSGNRGAVGFKDPRSHCGNGGRGNLGDDLYQMDGHLPSNSKSFPPSRARVDSPVFRGQEDSNPARAWMGAPNWVPSVANGFFPFPHGPPPVGFHPGMQPFPAPSMFGMRHSRELNHSRVPYPMHDADRFSGPFGWQNILDDSCPPFHAWNANNGVMGNDPYLYGRLDWDHSRNMINSQGWDTGVDPWKQNGSLKGDGLVTVLSDQGDRGERDGPDLPVEKSEINLPATGIAFESSDDVSGKTDLVTNESKDDDAHVLCFYLAKIDVSQNLAHPDLYDQCARLLEREQEPTADEDVSLEETGTGLNFSLSPTANDAVFQRAMSLYYRQKEEMSATYRLFPKTEVASSRDAKSCEEKSPVSIPAEPEKRDGAVLNCVHEGTEPEKQDRALLSCVPEGTGLDAGTAGDTLEDEMPTGGHQEEPEKAAETVDGDGGEVEIGVSLESVSGLVNLSRIHESTH